MGIPNSQAAACLQPGRTNGGPVGMYAQLNLKPSCVWTPAHRSHELSCVHMRAGPPLAWRSPHPPPSQAAERQNMGTAVLLDTSFREFLTARAQTLSRNRVERPSAFTAMEISCMQGTARRNLATAQV